MLKLKLRFSLLVERSAKVIWLKIRFDRLSATPVNFESSIDRIKFNGRIKKSTLNLAKCNGKLTGELEHICDSCGADIILSLDEEIDLNLSDGIYKDSDNELSNTIEFYSGVIDTDEILISELEAFKSDYFYCDKCKILEGE